MSDDAAKVGATAGGVMFIGGMITVGLILIFAVGIAMAAL